MQNTFKSANNESSSSTIDPRFIEVLPKFWEGADFGYLWALNPANKEQNRTLGFKVGGKLPAIPTGWNAYFGVNPTSTLKRTKAAEKDIAAVNFLYSEFDAKDFSPYYAAQEKAKRKIEDLTPEEREIVLAEGLPLVAEHIDSLEPAPSIRTHSGGGEQCFWYLERTYQIQTDENREWFKALQKKWVRYTGGDKSVHNLDRVLRLPGTLNYKYSPPRRVEIIELETTRRAYPLDLFVQLTANLPDEDDKDDSHSRAGTVTPLSIDDQALIEKAHNAKTGAKFARLWAGHHDGDHSAADQSLCNMLAYWTQRDADRMDRLFRQSGLYRDKWDERRGAGTYGGQAIAKAISSCNNDYDQNYGDNDDEDILSVVEGLVEMTIKNKAAQTAQPHTNGNGTHHTNGSAPSGASSTASNTTQNNGSGPGTSSTTNQGSAPTWTFKPMRALDVLKRPKKQFLIDRILGPGDMGMIFGAPGSGKTFVAIDLVIAAATGTKWADEFDIVRPLNVTYCLGEGLSGFPARLAAAMEYWGVKDLPGFVYFEDVPQLFDATNPHSTSQFLAGYKDGISRNMFPRPDLLIIDTLHAATEGADENSAKEMGQVLGSMRLITKTLGCAVLVQHHTNKAGRDERGSTSLRGAMDLMIRISQNGKGFTMEREKLKDGDPWEPKDFMLTSKLDSVRVSWVDMNAVKSSTADAVKDHLDDNVGDWFTIKALAVAVGIGESTVQKAVKELSDKGLITRKLKDTSRSAGKGNPLVYGSMLNP